MTFFGDCYRLNKSDSSKPSCLKTKLWANLITLMNFVKHIVYLCAFFFNKKSFTKDAHVVQKKVAVVTNNVEIKVGMTTSDMRKEKKGG